MNKNNRQKTIVKTDKMHQRKLTKVANRFNISPLSVRELQLGFPETIPERAANKLIKEGYAVESKDELRDHQSRVNDLPFAKEKVDPVKENTESNKDSSTTENTESITNTDNGDDTFCITDNPTVTSDPKENDEEL